MSFASSSRVLLRGGMGIGAGLRIPKIARPSHLPRAWPLPTVNRSFADQKAAFNDEDPDQPPPKATIRERLRFLTRRYGWWALGVYLAASTLDFSLTFLAIHLMGADHIRELENKVRSYLGLGSREMDDAEVAAWPVPVSVEFPGKTEEGGLKNNEMIAKKALQRVQGQKDIGIADPPAKKSSQSTIWTEAVLAYTIHKTLLLPFRVGVTAAATPRFVKYMVRMGWARDNAAVQQAAKQAHLARQARKSSAAK